jgi:hypothetical protein
LDLKIPVIDVPAALPIETGMLTIFDALVGVEKCLGTGSGPSWSSGGADIVTPEAVEDQPVPSALAKAPPDPGTGEQKEKS